MKVVGVIAAFFFSRAICSLAQSINGNLFVDGIISAVNFEYGERLDTIKLPEKALTLNMSLFFVKLSGEARLFNGSLNGFKSTHRKGDSSLQGMGQSTLLVSKLEAGPLSFQYWARAGAFGYGANLLFKGSVSSVQIDLSLKVNSVTRLASIKHFYLSDLGEVTVAMASPGIIGYTDYISNLFIKAIVKVFKPVLKFVVDLYLGDMVASVVKDSPIPILFG